VPLLFYHFLPDHGVSALGTFYGGTFYTLLMRLLVPAFGANAITTGAKTAAVVAAVSATTAQPLAGAAAVSVSKQCHNFYFFNFRRKDNEHMFIKQGKSKK
jgi:hypothetical protein